MPPRKERSVRQKSRNWPWSIEYVVAIHVTKAKCPLPLGADMLVVVGFVWV